MLNTDCRSELLTQDAKRTGTQAVRFKAKEKSLQKCASVTPKETLMIVVSAAVKASCPRSTSHSLRLAWCAAGRGAHQVEWVRIG